MVPVYNGAPFLRECLSSLVGQTWPRCDILVMDDASIDETPAIIASFGDSITCYRQPSNRGQFRNAEDGIARATGEYVAVYHADDIYDPDIVEREVEFLERHPESGLVFPLIRMVDAGGREYGRLELPDALRGRESLIYAEVLNSVMTFKNVFMATPGAMARTGLFREVGGFRPEFGSAADLDMWLRCARLTRIGLLERHLLSYRHTTGSQGQSYQLRRTVPENFFAVVDRELASYGESMATAASCDAFEAHRAVDALRVAVNAYIKADMPAARGAWRSVSPGRLLGSPRIRRPRHLLLWVLVGILCRLPRISWAASALDWRYYRRLPWWQAS